MNTLETNDIDDKLSKFGSFADSLSRLLLVENRARFTTSLDVYGNKYEPNSPVWIRRKGNNKPTLGLTGQMRDNITVNPNNKDTIRIFSYMDYSSFGCVGFKVIPNYRPTFVMNELRFSNQDIMVAMQCLVSQASDGDIKAAVAILDRTIAKLKPKSEPVMLKTTKEVKEAFEMGLIDAEQAKASLEVIGLLAEDNESGNTEGWTPEMIKFMEHNEKEKDRFKNVT
jgi:hypothetical protein